METGKKTFQLEIVTPERRVFGGEALFAVLPGREGEFGVLPNHATLLAQLVPGVVKVTTKQGEMLFAVSDGFAEVRNNTVTVVTETAEQAEEIDAPRAREAYAQALKALETATEKKEHALAGARVKKQAARMKIARNSPAQAAKSVQYR